MAKKKAPAKLTGGAGFRYEDHIAARFLLDLLGGTNSLGSDFGRVACLDWQARDAGWLADDLAISCTASNGERAAGLSIKSDRQVTSAGFPDTFVDIAWGQWLGEDTSRKFREQADAIVLVTGHLAQEAEEAWSKTLSEALQTTPERMIARMSSPSADEGALASQVQRAMFQSFCCPERMRGRGDTDDVATVRLICHVRLLRFDFESPTSQDRVRALADCQRVLRAGNATDAAALWDRLIGLAAEKRVAGGSADRAEVLKGLQGRFDLLDHPDYRADWEAVARHSREMMDDVHTVITGLPALVRHTEQDRVVSRLRDHGACVLVGESGSGKSALAKQAAECYRRIVWLTEDVLDGDHLDNLERRLNLGHPLVEVLRASAHPCLLVFDGVEAYTERGLRLAARLIRELPAAASPGRIHLLLTTQFETSRRIISRLAEHGVPLAMLDVTPIPRPSEDDVRDVVAGLHELRWTALRPELRPLLTNLKILDWVVAAVRRNPVFDDRRVVGLTTLIDHLWERWAEGDDGGFARSHLLMQIAVLEADTLTAGVPRTRLGHAEQQMLRSLVASDLLHVREEKVRFSHDLLGDWARMRVLVGEAPTATPGARDRAASPRWHRAVRLWAQRLLEQTADGCDQWRRSVTQLQDGSEAGQILRDLHLESVFLATNARELLERVWPALAAEEGRLLLRLLDRFLFVATLPDPRLAQFADTPEEAARLEHAFRVPFLPYWGPVLAVLHAHREEFARIGPLMAARVCSLWLRTMPLEWEPGRPMPGRHQAAELAIAAAREVQGRRAEGIHFSSDEDKDVYEAALYAAPDFPDAVASLCLELSRRRDPSAEIRAREERAQREADERNRSWREANPEQANEMAQRYSPFRRLGPLRQPWPDGPRERVEEAFQNACLDTPAFPGLVRARPDVALEVLLAVCIEEPQHEDSNGSSLREDCGLEHWFDGHPPLYFRGPFLLFLREAPEHGLSFVLRLVNFATRRCVATEPRRLAHLGLDPRAADLGVTVTVDGQPRRWYGDPRTFTWHHDWPHDASVVPCALMALERWLYEQLDQGVDIEPCLARILAESESLAFAGLLLDIAKRESALLVGVLRPLMRTWELYHLDLQATVQRSGGSAGLIGWRMQSPKIASLAREWYGMPHRLRLFQDVAADLVPSQTEMRPFFEEVTADWRRRLDGEGNPDTLQLLIERLSPQNYTEQPQADGSIRFAFALPEQIQERNDASLRESDAQSRLMTFPFQCRQRLDTGTTLSRDELLPFWETLRAIDVCPSSPPTESGHALVHVEDSVSGGIAVLLALHRDWVAADSDRMAWCRQKLEKVLQQPPTWSSFDNENAIGDRQWDAFAAECGIALLAENRDDPLARSLVAVSVVAYRYATSALTMERAFRCRERLGEDFDRMLNLAIRWAGVRSLYNRARQLQFKDDRWLEQQRELIEAFENRLLPVDRPALREVDATALAEIEDLHARRSPERPAGPRRRRGQQIESGGRETLRVAYPGIDLRGLASACVWFDLKAARSPEERRKWVDLLRELLEASLTLLPFVDDPRRQEIDGLPHDFDNWVYGVISRAIPAMTPAEDPDALWRRILELGTPAHRWVERFFWHWFIEGVQVAESAEAFTVAWERMLRHALASPLWDPVATYDLDGMVFELLGFHFGVDNVAGDSRFTSALGRMEDVFALAARRWFVMPRIMSGFARFVVEPAAAELLLPGVRWLWEGVRLLEGEDWQERNLEEGLVGVLHQSWERQSARVSGDPVLREAFLGLLTSLASRGGHAATALRDRVLNSIGDAT